MRNWFIFEVFRRLIVITGLILAGLFLSQGQPLWFIAIAAVLGVGTYIFVPRERIPEDASRMALGRAVIGLDLAASILALPFLVFAISLIGHDGMPAWWMVALITSPLIVCGLVLFWMAVRNACLWMVLEDEGFRLADIFSEKYVSFSDIADARTHVFRMPKWGWFLLAAFGGPRGAGMALLHGERQARYLTLTITDGTVLTLPTDGFPAAQELAQKVVRL